MSKQNRDWRQRLATEYLRDEGIPDFTPEELAEAERELDEVKDAPPMSEERIAEIVRYVLERSAARERKN